MAPAEARWVTAVLRLGPEAARQLGPGAHAMHFDISLLSHDAAGRDAVAASLSEKSTFVVPH